MTGPHSNPAPNAGNPTLAHPGSVRRAIAIAREIDPGGTCWIDPAELARRGGWAVGSARVLVSEARAAGLWPWPGRGATAGRRVHGRVCDADVLRAAARLVDRGRRPTLAALAAEVTHALRLDPPVNYHTICDARARLLSRGVYPQTWMRTRRGYDAEGRPLAPIALVAELERQLASGRDVVNVAEAARGLGIKATTAHSRFARLPEATRRRFPTRINRDRSETVGSEAERRAIERRIAEARRAREAEGAETRLDRERRMRASRRTPVAASPAAL